MQKLMHNMKDVNIILPVSVTTAQGGNLPFISMKNAQHASIVINIGAGSGTAPTISLQQAKNVEGNGNKALAFTKVWKQVPGTSPLDQTDLWTEIDVTGNAITGVANERFRIELDAAQLDVDNGYDCFRFHMTAPGISLVMSVHAELTNLRYTGEGNLSQPSAKVN